MLGLKKVQWAAASLGATALVASPVYAGFAVDTPLDTRVGLARITHVDCHGVDFGLWRVPTRNTGGSTFITLAVSANDATGVTTASATGNTTSVSLDSRHAPQAGTCYVYNAETVAATIKTEIFQNVAMHMGGLPLYGQPSPSIQALVVADLALGGNSVAIDTTGNGSFRIVGTLTIPQNIVAGNYGGYQTTGEGKVSITDGL